MKLTVGGCGCEECALTCYWNIVLIMRVLHTARQSLLMFTSAGCYQGTLYCEQPQQCSSTAWESHHGNASAVSAHTVWQVLAKYNIYKWDRCDLLSLFMFPKFKNILKGNTAFIWMQDEVFHINLVLMCVRCLKFAYEAPNRTMLYQTVPNRIALNWTVVRQTKDCITELLCGWNREQSMTKDV